MLKNYLHTLDSYGFFVDMLYILRLIRRVRIFCKKKFEELRRYLENFVFLPRVEYFQTTKFGDYMDHPGH